VANFFVLDFQCMIVSKVATNLLCVLLSLQEMFYVSLKPHRIPAVCMLVMLIQVNEHVMVNNALALPLYKAS
jgi:hypothetical protein